MAWTFLSNHGHVLVAVSRDPHARVLDLAATVGITPRAVQLILADLVAAGYLSRQRVGRRTAYTVRAGRLRHPAEQEVDVTDLLRLFAPEGGAPAGGADR